MASILIIYHTQSSNTQKMAEAVAAGAASVKNTKVVLKKANDAAKWGRRSLRAVIWESISQCVKLRRDKGVLQHRGARGKNNHADSKR